MKHARSRVRTARGFTLVELMVSLVAGLIVTIAVIGLARAATATFFEAARISSVEATVRTAAERLRQDLVRVSYMSTGNIRLARAGAPGVPMAHKIAVADPTAALTGSRYVALNDLQGIRIIVGGSGNAPIPGAGTAGPNVLSASNVLNPDAAILAGNFTTDDSYQGTYLPAGGACAGGQMIQLNVAADAAVRRLLTSNGNPQANIEAAFTPVIAPPTLFSARVVDARGCQHYVVVCGVVANAAGAQISIAQDAGGGPGLLPGTATNCGVRDLEPVTINPVQRVRWYVGPNVDATLDPTPGVEAAGNKFNLYRDFLDAANPPAPIVPMRQIVAEFMADLKFGITVADAANALQVFEMDTDPGGGAGAIDTYTQTASTTVAGQPGPQRVRSVRFRVATRAAVPDRTAPILPSGAPYLTRYCIEALPAATCTKFARVRTVVSEAALTNQLGMTY